VSMVYLRVFAGLGNQQFQYAFAKSLSLKYQNELVIDSSYFLKRYHPIKYQGFLYPYKLENFNINEPHTEGIRRELIGILTKRGKLRRIYQTLVNKNLLLKFLPVLIDQHNLSEKIFCSGRAIILCDYFQKSDIFENYCEEIRAAMSLKSDLTILNKSYLEIIKNSLCSVSIHVRRTDYVEKANVKNNFALVNIAYYLESLRIINSKENIDRLFIFSDDIDWVKKNIHFDYDVTFIEGNGPDYQHQYLMSQCKHNIISNSTFSWWAAWLNKNLDKIICVPSRWFADDMRSDDIYIPNSWTRVSN
jgi:hypothetical protein